MGNLDQGSTNSRSASWEEGESPTGPSLRAGSLPRGGAQRKTKSKNNYDYDELLAGCATTCYAVQHGQKKNFKNPLDTLSAPVC